MRSSSPPQPLAPRTPARSGDDPCSIVAFWFFDDWGRFGRTYENLVVELSRLPEVERVVLVFPPRTVSPPERAGLEVRRVSEKLTLLTELEAECLPAAGLWSHLAARLRRARSGRVLRRFLEREGFRRPATIAWYFPPHSYIDRLRAVVSAPFTVSQIVDDFTVFDPDHFLHAFAVAQYPQVAGWSDVILTSSRANFEKFGTTAAPCYRFDPGVDASFLAAPAALPHRTRGGKPRLGYVGFIMERTDLDLLAYLAGRHPEWRIALVGPEHPPGIVAASGLLEFANVEFLGAMAHEEVPAFLQSLDVCLIPHRDDAFSRSMAPLKLLQYLASGRPVVATDVAGLEYAGSQICIAHDYAEFERMVAEVLEGDTAARSAERIDAARSETWDLRTRQLFDLVLRERSERGNPRARGRG